MSDMACDGSVLCPASNHIHGCWADLDYPDQVPARIRDLALNARNAAAAPEYDEEAIRGSLWALVDAVMDCQVFA